VWGSRVARPVFHFEKFNAQPHPNWGFPEG
jgi:hypothetical protein